MSAVIADDLDFLCRAAGLPTASLAGPLGALSEDLRLLTTSFLGLQLVMVDHGRVATLTSFRPQVAETDIVTSLRVPLNVLTQPVGGRARQARGRITFDPASALTWYAATPGAFVDLAADLEQALQVRSFTRSLRERRQVRTQLLRLDQDLVPTTLTSGLHGSADESTVNRAIGMLIGEGHEVEAADRELSRRAETAGTTVLTCAALMVRGPVAL